MKRFILTMAIALCLFTTGSIAYDFEDSEKSDEIVEQIKKRNATYRKKKTTQKNRDLKRRIEKRKREREAKKRLRKYDREKKERLRRIFQEQMSEYREERRRNPNACIYYPPTGRVKCGK